MGGIDRGTDINMKEERLQNKISELKTLLRDMEKCRRRRHDCENCPHNVERPEKPGPRHCGLDLVARLEKAGVAQAAETTTMLDLSKMPEDALVAYANAHGNALDGARRVQRAAEQEVAEMEAVHRRIYSERKRRGIECKLDV